jgi:hypothetical protein
MPTTRKGQATDENISSSEVHKDIKRIRGQMDHTLEEIGDYLHPKHALDYLVDSFSAGSAAGSKEKVQEFARQGLGALKRHPGPAVLLGGAILWYLTEDSERNDRSSHGSKRAGRAAIYGAWEDGYQWSQSPEDEQTWAQRARTALDDVRAVIADTTIAAKDKVKSVAKKMVGVSGKTREEIHAQWADLHEHSGSVVDARTGEPYDDSYGDDRCQSSLEACARVSDEDADDSSWTNKAEGVVKSISASLKNTGGSAKEQLRSIGDHISGLVASAGGRASEMTSHMASSTRHGVSRGLSSAATGLHTAADSAREGAHRVGDALGRGVEQGRQQFQRTPREQPLAVGAAALGLGLLAGLLVPSTRAENELMGEAAHQVKNEAQQTGAKMIKRGEQVASDAIVAVSEKT